VQWTKVGNVRSYNGFDGSASEIDRTNFDSTAKEFILGLVDPGHFGVEVDQDNSDAGQIALMTAMATGLIRNFKLQLPNGNSATFTAYVKKFSSQGAVDQAIRRSADLRISGAVTWA
ncbi:MAG: phage tail protein, partial [Betaproteobacteria bacterium]|nr:phage tail protein [Betaproteobacteria bacterium]